MELVLTQILAGQQPKLAPTHLCPFTPVITRGRFSRKFTSPQSVANTGYACKMSWTSPLGQYVQVLLKEWVSYSRWVQQDFSLVACFLLAPNNVSGKELK